MSAHYRRIADFVTEGTRALLPDDVRPFRAVPSDPLHVPGGSALTDEALDERWALPGVPRARATNCWTPAPTTFDTSSAGTSNFIGTVKSAGRPCRTAAHRRTARAGTLLCAAGDHRSHACRLLLEGRAAAHRGRWLLGRRPQRGRQPRAGVRVCHGHARGHVLGVGIAVVRRLSHRSARHHAPRRAGRHARRGRGQSRPSDSRVRDWRRRWPEHDDDAANAVCR